MEIAPTNPSSAVELDIEGDRTIASAGELKDELCRALASEGDIRVSLERAGILDITAMQLLWAAAREAERNGHSLTFSGPVPEAIRAQVREARIPFPSLLEPNA